MENKTYSMRLPEHLIQRLDSRVNKKWNQGRSGRLIQDLEDYYSLLDYGLRSVKRKLTRNEATAILDILNSVAVTPGDMARWAGELISGRGDVRSALAHELADACDLDGLHTKWDLDRDQFLQKIDALSPLEHVALVDWAKQLWDAVPVDETGELWEQELSHFQK